MVRVVGRPAHPPPSRGPRGRRRRRCDRGHLAGLEAAFVGMLMVSSIAIFVSLDAGPGGGGLNVQRPPVEDLVGDLLQGLAALPSAQVYANQLEQAIAKAVQGNTTAFEDLVDRTLPPGAECRLFLDNGHLRRQLAGPTERLARESVSQAKLWRPQWAYAFGVPSLDLISSQQPLLLQGYEVSQGSLVKEYGVPLQWELQTDKGTYARATILGLQDQATATVTLLDSDGKAGYRYKDSALGEYPYPIFALEQNGSPPTPHPFTVDAGKDFLRVRAAFTGTVVAYTLTLRDPNDVTYPLVVHNGLGVPVDLVIPAPVPGAWTMTGSGTHTGGLIPATSRVYANATKLEGTTTWVVQLREEAGKPLAPGVKLNLSFPQVFYDFALTSTTQPGWRNITWGEDLDAGAWIQAELNQTLNNAALSFTVNAHRPPNGNVMYVVHATLGAGATGKSTFVLSLPTGLTTSANDIEHELYASLPKPQAPGSTAHWGAVFPNPRTLPGAPAETVQQLDIRTADGSALFAADPVGVVGGGTWTRVSPGHIRWTGSHLVLGNEAFGLSFKVPTLSTAQSQHEPAIRVPVSFAPGDQFVMRDMAKPYVFTASIPPPIDVMSGDQAGYEVPPDAGASSRGNATATIAQVQRGMLAKGEVGYGVSLWGTLGSLQEQFRLGVARSHLNITKSTVRIGEETNLTVDFQGLYDEITLLGATITGWNVEVIIFDPAQPFVAFDQMTPSFKGRFGANGQLTFADLTNPTVQSIAYWATQAAPQVKTLAKANVTFTPPKDAFYGPHAIVAQANFIVNDGLGNSMAQSVRQLGVIDVVPDSGQSGTALYWVVLECWLPDW